jgi:hypothetical protein
MKLSACVFRRVCFPAASFSMIPLFIISLGFGVFAQAQPSDTSAVPDRDHSSARAVDSTGASENNADWLLLPFASYAPETKLSGGLVVIVTVACTLDAAPSGRSGR